MILIFIISRWGRVRSVVTLREVAPGEELLVDYGYDLIRWHHLNEDYYYEAHYDPMMMKMMMIIII